MRPCYVLWSFCPTVKLTWPQQPYVLRLALRILSVDGEAERPT
jgi:hypothetical protein